MPQQRPAVDGWFTVDPDEPRLLGQRCTTCQTVVFPPRALACPNPACLGSDLEPAELSRRGRVWSWATNHYPPPEPYLAPDPFVPYTVVAARLLEEGIVVLGQLATDADPADLTVDGEVELALTSLFADPDGTEHVAWAWRPVAASGGVA